MALIDKLTAIADAIRAKTGGTEQLTLDQMAIEILNISGSSGVTMKDYLTARASDGHQFYNYKGTYKTLSGLLKYDDTSSVTNMSYMFYNCSNLTTIPQLDTSSVTNMNNMFYNCSKLTECYLKNIKANLQVGSGISYGHLLTVDSLLFLIKELRNTGSAKTLTVGSANLTKLADIYVKTITITDEMRAEDSHIDEKLPFEVCESTDEGAMLITNYVTQKNWALA